MNIDKNLFRFEEVLISGASLGKKSKLALKSLQESDTEKTVVRYSSKNGESLFLSLGKYREMDSPEYVFGCDDGSYRKFPDVLGRYRLPQKDFDIPYNQTRYGKLFNLEKILTLSDLTGNKDIALVTKDGEKLFGNPSQKGFRDAIQNLFSANYFDNRFVQRTNYNGKNILVKIAPCPVEVPINKGLGLYLELATLSEIQRFMQERDNHGKTYEFQPHSLYVGTPNLLITEWLKEQTANGAVISDEEARNELKEDLKRTGLDLDLTSGNIINLGVAESGRRKYGVIDQMDFKVRDKLETPEEK